MQHLVNMCSTLILNGRRGQVLQILPRQRGDEVQIVGLVQSTREVLAHNADILGRGRNEVHGRHLGNDLAD